MTRLLAFGILFLLIAYLLRRPLRGLGASPGAPPRSSATAATRSEPLVPCARCGVLVPSTRALAADDGSAQRFCSPACRAAS